MQTDQVVMDRNLDVAAPAAAGPDPLSPAAGACAWAGSHAVDLRLTLPWLSGRRFYVTLVAGRERRSSERRAEERRRHPVARFGNIILLLAVGTVVGLALFAALHLAAVLVLQRSGALLGA